MISWKTAMGRDIAPYGRVSASVPSCLIYWFRLSEFLFLSTGKMSILILLETLLLDASLSWF